MKINWGKLSMIYVYFRTLSYKCIPEFVVVVFFSFFFFFLFFFFFCFFFLQSAFGTAAIINIDRIYYMYIDQPSSNIDHISSCVFCI